MGSLSPLGDRREERARDLLFLDALPGVGPSRVRALVKHFGTAARAVTAPRADFERLAGTEAALARADPEHAREVDRALRRASRLGMVVLTWDADAYPEALRHLADPPPLLFLRGRTDLLGRRAAVTVVGSRKVTVRGRDVARRLGGELARRRVVVVSGLALGTDGEAHRGALENGGDTIAVLGTGADVAYPRTHLPLFRKVLERGLVVSEFAPGTRATPYNFPRRNRVLAAFGRRGIVVVEAGERSGSLITVDHALDLGRDVWTVPGPIDGPACAGSNRLLAEGARPLVSISGFVDEVADHASGARAAAPSGRPDAAERERAASEDALLSLLGEAPLAPDELAALADRPVPDVLAALTTLELDGRVVRLPGPRYRRAA